MLIFLGLGCHTQHGFSLFYPFTCKFQDVIVLFFFSPLSSTLLCKYTPLLYESAMDHPHKKAAGEELSNKDKKDVSTDWKD